MEIIGMRVGAIRNADKSFVHLFGYGVYDGDLEHPEMGIPNPRLTMDDGAVVWGCGCWWGAEDEVKASIGDREVIMVKPDRDGQ